MTEKALRKISLASGGYATPALNDVCYFHYKGFRAIENLSAYTGVRSLWLEGNGLTRIQGLEGLSRLVCLFLHENLISVVENLDCVPQLRQLNLACNQVQTVGRGLRNLTALETLNLSNNRLQTRADLEGLLEDPDPVPNPAPDAAAPGAACGGPSAAAGEGDGDGAGAEDEDGDGGAADPVLITECRPEGGRGSAPAPPEAPSGAASAAEGPRGALRDSLEVLDLSKNRIDDEGVLEVFTRLPRLKVLNLMGNPLVRTMARYRKTIVHACPALTYLDDRPVFADERRAVDAFFAGGPDAELQERRRCLAERRADDQAQFASMRLFMEGRPRAECLAEAARVRGALLARFEATGEVDATEQPAGADRPCDYCACGANACIWAEDEVEVVSREWLERRVPVRIEFASEESYARADAGAGAAGDDDDSVPDLERASSDGDSERESVEEAGAPRGGAPARETGACTQPAPENDSSFSSPD